MKPISQTLIAPSVESTCGPLHPTSHAPSRLVDFYELTKPRMNFLVLITTMIGFLLASSSITKSWMLLVNTLLGTALCAASSAILNQVIEKDFDAKMRRTRSRPIPAGRISSPQALFFGISAGLVGIVYLALAVNVLTALLGVITIAWYLLLYTPAKRFTTLNTVIGAVPGAIPPLMGFTAAANALSPAAISLFAILFLWQMPHFLAIALMYRDDYLAGGFKMLPSVESDPRRPITGRMMVLYSAALIPASVLPAQLHLAGAAYFTAAVLLGLAFLTFAISCAAGGCTRVDARKLFFASIIYLPLLLAAMLFDRM